MGEFLFWRFSWDEIIEQAYFSTGWQVSICRAINQNDGLLNKTTSEDDVFDFEQVKQILKLLRKANSAENSKKIEHWVCISYSACLVIASITVCSRVKYVSFPIVLEK